MFMPRNVPSVVSGTISCRGPEEDRARLGFHDFLLEGGGGVGGAWSDYAELGVVVVVEEHFQGLWRKAGAPGMSESRLFWRSLAVSRTQAAWSKLTNGFQTQGSKTHQF